MVCRFAAAAARVPMVGYSSKRTHRLVTKKTSQRMIWTRKSITWFRVQTVPIERGDTSRLADKAQQLPHRVPDAIALRNTELTGDESRSDDTGSQDNPEGNNKSTVEFNKIRR